MSDPAILAAFERFSAAWRGKDWPAVEDSLSERVVFLVPRFAARLEGLAACLDSFRSFARRCQVLAYEEHDIIVDRTFNSAVVTFRWRMRWREGDREHHDTGREILFFADEDGVWRIVWRVMLEDAG